MVKINSNKFIINMITLYVSVLFFYGIIVKFTIWNPTLFTFKTYIPEIILVLCTLISIITNKIRLNNKILLLFSYSVFVIVINYIVNGANTQSLYWWRDLFIPLFSSMILLQRKFTKEDIDYLFSKLVTIAKIFLVLGLILVIVEQIEGDVWTSKFYTGYVFYGQDPNSKVKIAHNMGLLRAPSLTGNFSTFAYYSCFCLFLIMYDCRKRNHTDVFWSIISLLCCILSTNKSAILTLLAVIIIDKTINIRGKNKHINRLLLLLIFGIISTTIIVNSATIFNKDSKLTDGFIQRFDVWNEIIKDMDWMQIIFPYKTFLYGSGSESSNSFFDNIYLYCFTTQGIIGLLLWVMYLKNLYKNLKNNYDNDIVSFVKNSFYFFLIIGLTSNTIQGHAYFCFMIIIFSILYRFNSKGDDLNEIN